MRNSLWLRAAAPVAVLALALTACGGSDDSASADKKPADAVGKADTKPQEEEPKELAVGESAEGVVEEDAGKITYTAVAKKVDVGTEEDTKKLVSDPKKAEGLVPVVAHLEYTLKDGGVVPDYPSVNDDVEIHADGQRGTILIGASDDAQGCDDKNEIENWKKGESYVLCETYMIPVGAKELQVHWTANDDAEPAIWKFATS
ncbi:MULTISPECIES: hypothetical protein [Streptomyces]|uniref:Lipoprotein n=1 Tax=Streptomyces lycii TaxID=2654337 RepID=A0ABQ7FPV1_9ACTN|nr:MULTISPECIES: hypothetical protein [Streptomyces]KAF4410429.1 hypothetical protein GCU69_03765 [Streptomyces lycii]PGH48928.1 hypothetical protein CRI70_20545 [Streptomyces sp. Ru87]